MVVSEKRKKNPAVDRVQILPQSQKIGTCGLRNLDVVYVNEIWFYVNDRVKTQIPDLFFLPMVEGKNKPMC